MVLRRQVGRQFENWREAAGIRLTDRELVAITGSTRTVKRLEQGARVRLTFPVIGELCDYYGVPAQEKYEMQRIWRLVDEATWAQPSHAVVASGFDAYVGFERIATRFDLYSTVWVPGQFQDENYIRRIFKEDPFTDDSRIPDLVEQRLHRQEGIRRREPAPTMRVLLSEAVLRYGCDEGQIERLMEEDSKPHITIKYMAFEDGPPPKLDVPFNVLSFSDSADPSIVYLESPYERRFYEKREVVNHYLQIIDLGCQRARSMREFKP